MDESAERRSVVLLHRGNKGDPRREALGWYLVDPKMVTPEVAADPALCLIHDAPLEVCRMLRDTWAREIKP